MRYWFVLEDDVLKGYFRVRPGDETQPFTGHKFSDFVGEGVTDKMVAAFESGREHERRITVGRVGKAVEKLLKEDK